MKPSVCATDDDYEAWRAVRIAVVPGERCLSVAELRAQGWTDVNAADRPFTDDYADLLTYLRLGS